MRDESEIKLKRAYWEGVYYALDPEDKLRSARSLRPWLAAEVWLTALDWALGQATEPATTFHPMSDIPFPGRWEDERRPSAP